MIGFYNTLDKLKEALEASDFVNTVTYGDITDIDLAKRTIFPLSHFMLNNFTYQDNIIIFSGSLLCMDIVDVIKREDGLNDLNQNTNEANVLNTQMSVIIKVLDSLKSGDLHRDRYKLVGDPTVEAFSDRFDNRLTGWVADFQIAIVNDESC